VRDKKLSPNAAVLGLENRSTDAAANAAIRRNNSQFPDDLMFELTKEETETLICQFGILKPRHSTESRGGNGHLPFAFTEAGVAILSSALKSERAIQINISSVRAFIQLR